MKTILLTLILAVSTLAMPTTGGRVTNGKGRAIPGARVTLYCGLWDMGTTVWTGSKGYYSIPIASCPVAFLLVSHLAYQPVYWHGSLGTVDFVLVRSIGVNKGQ